MQLEQFTALERDAIEKCFLHGDYCGSGALARANIKSLLKEFGNLEDEAFTIEREAYSTEFVKFKWEIFEDKRDCIVGASQGIYIPQIFATNLSEYYMGASQSDIDICAKGPHENENGEYWEAWQAILDTEFVDAKGEKCTLEQDGDLFCVYTVAPEIERLHEVLCALINYPVIDDEELSRQEEAETQEALKNINASDLDKHLGEGVHELDDKQLEELKQDAWQALTEEDSYQATFEQQGACIDVEKLAEKVPDYWRKMCKGLTLADNIEIHSIKAENAGSNKVILSATINGHLVDFVAELQGYAQVNQVTKYW